jgi:iron complex outermembrane receptor protein
VLAAANVGAQVRRDTTTRADSLATALEKVVVTSARAATVTGGASALIVDPVRLNTAPAPTLQDVLRLMPFVLVRQNSRGEVELSMRGSESRQMAVTVDGLPITLGWDHRSDPSLVPMSGVQSVRLVRGLSSLLHGPNVLGGIVELGLGSSSLGPSKEHELTISSGLDVDGAMSFNVLAGQSGGEDRGLSLRAGAGLRSRDGYPLSHEVDDQYSTDDLRSNTQMDHRDGFAALRWRGSSGAYVGLTATGYQTERGVAPELHVDGPRFWKYPNQARTLGVLSLGTGVMRTPLGYGHLDVRGGYTRGTLHIEAFEDASFSTLDSEERGDERLTNLHLMLTHSFLFNGNLKAAFSGGKVRYEEILGDTHSDFEQRIWSTGFEVEIPFGGRLLMSGGLVNDATTTPMTAGRTPLPRRSDWGWRVGGSLLAFADEGRIHASVSERSRFPALRELYSGALNRFEPNPGLKPETILATELGYSVISSLSGSRVLDVQVVGFHHNMDDMVVRTTLPSNRFFRLNRDRVSSTGLELFASLAPANGARGFSATADITAQNINVENKVAGAPLQLEHQPEFKARVELGVPLVLETQGFASMRHVGKLYCLHPDGGELVELKAQSVLDAALNRTFRVRSSGLLSTLKAVFAVDNALDAAVYDQCGLPQPGRVIRLGLQLF